VARFAALATNTRAAKRTSGFWCVPYLLYTHSLTGRTFYWGTNGGMSLYWISTPYPSELGSWFSVTDVKEKPELAPHREFFAKLEQLSDVERDDALKKQAVYNIITLRSTSQTGQQMWGVWYFRTHFGWARTALLRISIWCPTCLWLCSFS
jgi:hypothetical protein